MVLRIMFAALMHMACTALVSADDEMAYPPDKVIYDLSSPKDEVLGRLLDRANVLQNIYGNDPFEASIIIVVHEGAIPLFTNHNRNAKGDLMRRAASLAMGEVIEFRLCSLSARMQGFSSRDFPDFVTMVPMADAEIVRLQQEGYAYLH